MQREITKFTQVESAFQKIKASTGVNIANEIVKKFLTREQTYSHLLISIAEYEKKIDMLRHENDELKVTFEKLKSEFDNFDKEFLSNEQQKDWKKSIDLEKHFLEIEEKAQHSILLEKKLSSWIEKNLIKLQRAGLVDEKVAIESSKASFNQILNSLKHLLALNKEEQLQVIDQVIRTEGEELFITEFQKKNVRVKAINRKRQTSSTSQEWSRDEEDFSENQDQMSKIDEQSTKYTFLIHDKVDEDPTSEDNHLQNLREEIKIVPDQRKKK